MRHVMHPGLRRLLLACTILLGLQFCFPLTMQASVVANQRVDIISLGTKDPAQKPGLHVDFDLVPFLVLVIQLPERLDVACPHGPCPMHVVIPTLLPVAGFHPSAP